MEMKPGARSDARAAASLLPLLLLVVGCATHAPGQPTASQLLSAEVQSVFRADRSTAEYHQSRARLQAMGPELDTVLIAIVDDPRARVEARSDALILLADRESPQALATLQRALVSDNERLRSAAVLGLNRISTGSDRAMQLIREAAGDRSRLVRLNALQSLDIREVATIRRLLENENDPELRQIALQLVSLAESRGAPLAADARGALRTAAGPSEPQIVFRPVTMNRDGGLAWGDLRVELPVGSDLPLATSALAVGSVVPAFFSPDRSAVVVESAGEIHVFDVGARRGRFLGPGLAPRLIPFSHEFVFLREAQLQPAGASPVGEVSYEVHRGSFGPGEAERIGTLRAVIRPEAHGGESPVRLMVVAESAEGFVLRGAGIETFHLPAPVWRPGRPAPREGQ